MPVIPQFTFRPIPISLIDAQEENYLRLLSNTGEVTAHLGSMLATFYLQPDVAK